MPTIRIEALVSIPSGKPGAIRGTARLHHITGSVSKRFIPD